MIFPSQPYLIFAPMATVSHAGFRHLIEDWGGCSLYFTEMIDAGMHLAKKRYESHYADSSPNPEKVVFQIVGADPDELVAAARSLAYLPSAGIDVNMGCSAPHIFRHGAGIAWMKEAGKAAALAERLRRATGTKLLSMKLRLGEREDEEALVAFAQALQNAGADFLTLHPRVRSDSLSRPARWEWVTKLRGSLSIPVVGNGDLDRFEVLQRRQVQDPADAWMVGRRAVAAPWTFAYWRGRWENPDFDLELDLKAICERFHQLLEAHQPQDFWVSRSRRFYSYFSKNVPFGHAWGARMQNAKNYGHILASVESYWREHDSARFRRASELESGPSV